MKKLFLLFSVIFLTGCDLGELWNDMILEVIHNRTGQKFTLKKDDVLVFSLDNNSKFSKKYQGRTSPDESIFYYPNGKYSFEFEDGKVLEVEITSAQFGGIESIISKNNTASSKGGGVRVSGTINYYITEEVYLKAK
ncbi:hypothetical protein MCERE19_03482 [Spirosomataceae bacterium]|jgi:hypothetical protein